MLIKLRIYWQSWVARLLRPDLAGANVATTIPFRAVGDQVYTPCVLQTSQPEFSILYQHLKLLWPLAEKVVQLSPLAEG